MNKSAIFSVVFIASLPLYGQMNSIPMKSPVPKMYTPTKLDLYTAYCGLWRTDATYESTIRLSNQLAASPIDATVTLFMADGTAYPLPVAHIMRSGVKTINVNAMLAAAPSSIVPHISQFGSASVSYRYDWQGTVLSTMSVLDVIRSLEYDYNFRFPASTASAPVGTKVEGATWSYSSQTEAFLALANTSGELANVSLTILDAEGAALSTQQLPVPPKNTILQRFATAGMGGVRVVSQSSPETLLLSGGMEDIAHGYSAQLPLAPLPDAATTESDNSAASVGIMVGVQDPMMGFPADLRFTPYAYFRNNGAQPVQVYTQAMYTQGGRPQSLALPSLLINPHQTRQLHVDEAIKNLGINGEISLVFSYHGQSTAILTSTGAVNQTGTYVFAVEPHAVGGRCSSKSSTYWRTDGGFDTMYSIWNSKAEPEDLLITFQYGDAQSYLYPVHLDANGMAMVDIRDIVLKAQPDVNEKLLPLSVTEGSFLVENAAGRKVAMSIVMSGGIYNPKKATCGNVTETCNGCTSYYVAPNPFGTAIGQSPTQLSSGCTMYDGTNDGFSGSWSSANASVVSISTGGMASPAGAGSTTLTSSMANTPVNMGTFTSYNYIPCQYTTASPQGQGNVCGSPTGETTTFSQWGDNDRNALNYSASVAEFVQNLTPSGGNYGGATVTESNASPATDSCYFNGSSYPPVAGVTGGSWQVGSTGNWGADYVGYSYSAFSYYQTNRPKLGLALPCGFRMFQQLTFKCPSGNSVVYDSPVILEATISGTGITISREGTTVARTLMGQ